MKALIAAVQRRIANMVAEAIIRRIDDSAPIQSLQIDLLADETRSGVERIQEYGFSSVPVEGGRAIALFLGGNRDHGVVIATDDKRYRPGGMQPGDVAIYDDKGQSVLLNAAGITVKAATITLDGAVNVTGDLTVEGDATALTGSTPLALSTLRTVFNAHTHNENDLGGPTGPSNTSI